MSADDGEGDVAFVEAPALVEGHHRAPGGGAGVKGLRVRGGLAEDGSGGERAGALEEVASVEHPVTLARPARTVDYEIVDGGYDCRQRYIRITSYYFSIV